MSSIPNRKDNCHYVPLQLREPMVKGMVRADEAHKIAAYIDILNMIVVHCIAETGVTLALIKQGKVSYLQLLP